MQKRGAHADTHVSCKVLGEASGSLTFSKCGLSILSEHLLAFSQLMKTRLWLSGEASPGWVYKTLSFWVKGSHTEMNIWCWTEMRESVLPLQFTWQLLSVTGSLWKGQQGSIYQKVGSGFALSEPPASCSQCKWNTSSYSGLQEELGAFV